jgi:hypothetical protein
MTITLYNNASDPLVVDKSLSNALTLTGELREMCDIENPSLLIESTTLLNYNYAYIPDFNRYYFFKKPPTAVAKNLMLLELTEDYLMSYKTEIKATKAIIKRQERNYNKYLNDPDALSYSYEILSAYAFDTPFTKASIPYLTMLGGV